MRRPSAVQAFPATSKLLSSIKPIEKQPQTRKPTLSKEGSVVYLATRETGMTAMQAIETANRRGLTLIPNNDIDERLNENAQLWQAEKEFYPCWTGTLIIYTVPDLPFGREIIYKDLRVKIPDEWQHRKNCAIACNHPDFTLGNDGLITLKNAALIENFPKEKGWHLPEQNFGIPSGELSNTVNPNARNLWRANAAFVGLLTRGFDSADGYFYCAGVGRNVFIGYWSGGHLGVLAYTKKE